MARLRLFANLREAAGTADAEVDGSSVAEVLHRAAAAFGADFASGLPHARVWVNGEPAEPGTAVGPADEVALIPPVSGGALTIDAATAAGYVMAGGLGLALVLANLASLRWFVVVLVAVAGVWLWDLAGNAAGRGLPVNAYPAFATAVGAAVGAYRWGFAGFAFALVAGVALMLVWALAEPQFRPVESSALTGLLVVSAALATGPLVLLRLRATDLVTSFVVVVVLAIVASRVIGVFAADTPLADANLAALAGAFGGGLIAGAVFGDLATMMVAAVVAAAGLVAGRAFGSLLRAGQIFLSADPPGFLASLDGPLFAAGLFWVTFALLA